MLSAEKHRTCQKMGQKPTKTVFLFYLSCTPNGEFLIWCTKSGIPHLVTRGRKEVGQVAKEEELDRQGSDTDTSLDSDDNTMVAWEEEEESE